MTISIKHSFVSAKGDGADATLVRPSAWNAAHATSMATGMVIGRQSAGVGPFEEIPITPNGAAILNSADNSSFGFITGDVKMSFAYGGIALNGWIIFAGTIGSAASGATNRANADTLALYTLIYNSTIDANFPVSGGRSGNAVNDFNANKTLNLGAAIGRVPVNSHSFAAPGSMFGEASHVLTQGELPAAALSVSVSGGASVSSTVGDIVRLGGNTQAGVSAGSPYQGFSGGIAGTAIASTGSSSGSGVTSNMGSGAAHNNYQPSLTLAFMVKL